MEKKIVLKKPKWLRRFASAFLDIIIAFVLTFLLSFATNPLGNAIFDGDHSARETWIEAYVSTHLYTDPDSGSLTDVDLIKDITTFDENLTYFYENCTENKLDEYINKKKENDELFVFDSQTNSYVEIEYDRNDPAQRAKYKEFYEEAMKEALTKYLDAYLNEYDGFIEANTKINLINYFSLLLSFTIALLLVYLLVPFIDKQYRTVGKIAFKLKVVSKINPKLTPTKLQILFRQAVLIFFEFILTISTIGIVGIPLPIILIFSIAMVLITKYNQSFHDLCCSTFLIDDYPSNNALNANEKYEITFINVNEEVK